MNNLREEIGILIADDHAIFRAGLRRVLETQPGFCVLGEAADGEQALDMARRLEPQILLLGIRMPRLSGLEVLHRLKSLAIPVDTLVLTAEMEGDQIVEALQQGARGILLKHAAADVLFEGIRSVAAGQYWVGRASVPDLAQAILKFKSCTDTLENRQRFCLTRRETEIIALIEGGYTDKEIANKLSLSELEVKNHLGDILEKLDVTNRLELVLFSIDHHLTDSLETNST